MQKILHFIEPFLWQETGNFFVFKQLLTQDSANPVVHLATREGPQITGYKKRGERVEVHADHGTCKNKQIEAYDKG